MKSCIRYYGSKGMFQEKIIKRFPNIKTYDTYIEAYGGGASVLFALEGNNIKEVEIYNDVEENVYSLMKVLQNKEMYNEFKRLCDLTYHSRQLNDEYRKKLREKDLSILDRAFMFFYLTRTSFNGLGGYSCPIVIRRGMSKGVSDYLSAVDRLYEYHQRLSKVQIENIDGVELLKKNNKENVFAYLDPPYTIEKQNDNNNYYKYNFNTDDQELLVNFLLQTKCKILLSGYKNKIYDKLEINNWKCKSFEVNTTKNNTKHTKTEYLWYNY